MASDRDTLPGDVKPSNYAISLFDLQAGEPWTYQGQCDIDIEIKRPVKTITLNTHELKVHSVSVSADAGKNVSWDQASNISYDVKNQRCTFTFDQELSPAKKAVLAISFEGTMNGSMAGFYRSKYKPASEPSKGVATDGTDHFMFSTQFESCDARRAIPCFDEPNLKATFDFEIEIPDDLTALSNMPEKETRKAKRDAHKVVSFERSPVMSTYLLAWSFGDFEYIEDFTRRKYNGKNLPVRVYTTKGLKEQGKVALDAAHQVVDYFSEIFDIDYPLPKVDILAVHEFSHGAMENWGLITFRTTAVLFDDLVSNQKWRNRIVYVVAHELAHQWFGNLVTMDWWNELWLNEGFATWVGWYAVDHLHPEWDVWGQFVTDGMQMAFQLDSLRTSHPIEVPVRNALEVDQIFDHISYLKGSSVIRMLAAHLGVKTFLKGVSDYLKANTYGNARTNDLWTALSNASGQDVTAFMDPWIRKIGFPVVTVAEEPGQITVKQSRFLSGGGVKPEEDETIWWIPIGLKTGPEATAAQREAFTEKSDVYRDLDTSFYKLNGNQTGFYRTNLPPQRLVSISKALDKLSVADKIGLVGDAGAMAIAGEGNTAAVLSFLEGFSEETNFFVWSEVLAVLGKIRTTFSLDPQVADGLRKFALKLVTSATDKIGWEFAPNEDYLTGQLRGLLVVSAGLLGHETVVTESQRRLQLYLAGDEKAIHPGLQSAVFRIGVKFGGKDAYLALRDQYQKSTSAHGKDAFLSSLGQVQSQELAKEHLAWAWDGNVPLQDLHTPTVTLANNSKVRDAVWAFIKEQWPAIETKTAGNVVVRERMMRMALSKFGSFKTLEEIEAFFKDKDTEGYDRGLAVACDSIRTNAQYAQRDLEIVREWLAAHGYVQ